VVEGPKDTFVQHDIVSFTPSELKLNEVRVGGTKSGKVTIKNILKESVKLSYTPDPAITAKVIFSSYTLPAQGRVQITIIVHPKYARPYRFAINVKTNNPLQPVIPIPVIYTGVEHKRGK
jgi:hypothetical protein